MLEIRNIHKAFDGLGVLKGVSLSVEKGDVVAILGKSGSGKTTLLRCINFLETADDGELVFDGETVPLHNASKRDIARIRKKTAFVPIPASFPAGSSSGWQSPEVWPQTRRSSSSMSPPRPSTRSSPGRCWPSCGSWPRRA